MGVLSTVSIPVWITVTGVDVSVMYARNKHKGMAANKLSKQLLKELKDISQYAPTLHAKIFELILVEVDGNWKRLANQLPKTLATDEKTQAQIAGVLFGRWAQSSSKPFTLWTVITTLLTQVGVKSVTKSAEAYKEFIDQRYKPIVDEMRSIDVAVPQTIHKPAKKLMALMKEAGVEVTVQQATTILLEVSTNLQRAHHNISNITKAVDEFNKAMKD